jgi:hypothetical protein
MESEVVMGCQAQRIEEWEEEHQPILIDDYREEFTFGKESQVHFEAKLEIQHLINALIHPTIYSRGFAAVEWMYPLNRVNLGRKFCWSEEDREFRAYQWLEVNKIYIPTPGSAISAWGYYPKFVFDIAVECGELSDVFEVTCTNPSSSGKRTFCRNLDVPFYEIDGNKFEPKYGKTEPYSWSPRRTYEPFRFTLPLLGGGELDLRDWAADFKRRYP